MGMKGNEGQENGFFQQQGMLADINITPFVDVVLVLLIILMVAAPFAVSGVDVRLPSSKAKPLSLGGDPLILSITSDGKFVLGKSRIPSRELADKLKVARGAEKEASIYIRADRAVPYGKVMEAMAAAQQAGIHRIGMLGESAAQDKSR